MTLAGTYEPSAPLTFNLGLPGLGLSVTNGGVDVSLIWTLALDFGIDRSAIVCLSTPASGNELTVAVNASLPVNGTTIAAQLGFLGLTATQATEFGRASDTGLAEFHRGFHPQRPDDQRPADHGDRFSRQWQPARAVGDVRRQRIG